MRRINPCHECGGTSVGYRTLVVYGSYLARVVCDECGAVGPWHVGLDKAADAWNELYREALKELHDPLNAIDTWAWDNGYV